MQEPPFTCPECGADGLVGVHDGELTNFVCPSCMRCWHVELGFAHRVSPATCPGCELAAWCAAVEVTARQV